MSARVFLFLALVSGVFAPLAAWCALPVAATTFPVYLIAENVAKGGGVDLSLLVSPVMGCPHDYQLTPGEMKKLSGVAVVIKNGLGFEDFLDRALTRAGGGVTVIDASSGITDLLTESEDGVSQVNPHIFASPKLSGLMALSIARGLSAVDPPNAALYAANATAYKASCDRLAGEFAALGARLNNRAVVTHHTVFDYLAKEMGLSIVGVIESHAGREPGAAELRALVQKARKSGAGAVFTEPQYPQGAGRAIARELSVPLAELDPVASGPENAPADYLFTVMRRNLAVMEKTLGVR